MSSMFTRAAVLHRLRHPPARSLLLAAALVAAPAGARAQPAHGVHGVAYFDQDGNGRRDPGDLPLSHVQISAGGIIPRPGQLVPAIAYGAVSGDNGSFAASAFRPDGPPAELPASVAPRDPAAVLRAFLVALHEHPDGPEPLAYLAPRLQAQVGPGRPLASVAGIPADYRSFCLAAFDPAAGSIPFLATLTNAAGSRQEAVLLTTNPSDGARKISAFRPYAEQTGPPAGSAVPLGCTSLGPSSHGPPGLPAGGGGGRR